MKKTIGLTIALLFAAGLASAPALFAQNMNGMMNNDSNTGRGMMGGQSTAGSQSTVGGNGAGTCPMGMGGGMPGMMGSMMMKSVTATTDGGIVVVAGNTITKYDKNLNVVKSVPVEMNADAMRQNVSQMMGMMGMMSSMQPASNSGMMGGATTNNNAGSPMIGKTEVAEVEKKS